MVPRERAQVWSLVRELDPACLRPGTSKQISAYLKKIMV